MHYFLSTGKCMQIFRALIQVATENHLKSIHRDSDWYTYIISMLKHFMTVWLTSHNLFSNGDNDFLTIKKFHVKQNSRV